MAVPTQLCSTVWSRKSRQWEELCMIEVIMDHDHPKTNVMARSLFSFHFDNETSYLQEVSLGSLASSHAGQNVRIRPLASASRREPFNVVTYVPGHRLILSRLLCMYSSPPP